MNGRVKKRIRQLLIFALLCPSLALAAWSSIAFNYAQNPPIQALKPYDVMVLDPEANINPQVFESKQIPLAYVSFGETNESAPYRSQLQPSWILDKNEAWQSVVMNEANPDWQHFFITQIITPLWKKGYRGFFIDTIDTYNRAANTPAQRNAAMQGVLQLLQTIHTQYPDAILILNRGFELLPNVAPYIQGMAAESLFQGWDANKKTYFKVTTEARDYLTHELNKVKALNLKAIAIDYAPSTDTVRAEQIEKNIQSLGFIPYVTDSSVQTVFTKSNIVQRHILVLYSKNNQDTIFNPDAFVLLGMPIQYMGFLPDYINANEIFSKNIQPKNYAGIIVWTNNLDNKNDEALYQFLLKAKNAGVKIAFFTNFGFKPTPVRLKKFNIEMPSAPHNSIPHLRITKQDKSIVGFEIQPHPNQYDYDLCQAYDAEVLLKLNGNHNISEDAIALTTWGGYALDPYVITSTPNNVSMWVIQPFLFLQKALALENFPVPDVTTENGERLAFIHIDGDGFENPAWWSHGETSAELLLNKVIKVYPLPTTFSVVTASLAPNGLYPTQYQTLDNIAKEFFKLPWVEGATHTFSHPFDWIKIKTASKNGVYNLPVKNYHFNETAELSDSIQFINEQLMPPNKKASVVLWSGLANADTHAFEILKSSHLLNMNGGNTEITYQYPYLSLITAMGLNVGNNYQVFAPINNEEYYTDGFKKPLYGYRKVIETFELTDKPLRLKPVDIYYHIYSAATEPSFNALMSVYQWALSQPLHWIYASDYIKKVNDANEALITSTPQGYNIDTNEVKELRLIYQGKFPDLVKSNNIIGYNIIGHMLYLHLGPETKTHLILSNAMPTQPYLLSANGKITKFTRHEHGFRFHLIGNLPLHFTLENVTHCTLKDPNAWFFKTINPQSSTSTRKTYHLKATDSHEIELDCQS